MIAVSACLAGIACRYDGKKKTVSDICRMVESGQAVTICPEVLGGLPIPRIPSERCGNCIINTAGEDVTAAFQRGAEAALKIAREHGCTAVILKARSPSCGYGQIYDGTFSGTLTEGNGVFAEMAAAAGIAVYNEENYRDLQINE
ncbi:MAG: DUF523 domain-containing protein [Clostridia bacterium]|nr:DUF523 domain-containing protein [Clostridia bacterium]